MSINPQNVRDRIAQRFESLKQDHDVAADEKGNAYIGDHRFNIMGADYFMADILHNLMEIYGEGAGAILKNTGQKYGDRIHGVLDGADDAEEELGYDLGLLKYLGYSEIDYREDTIEVSRSPTAVSYNRKHDKDTKTCYFLSGVFQSFLRNLDSEIAVQEVKCRADGSETCIFEIEREQ